MAIRVLSEKLYVRVPIRNGEIIYELLDDVFAGIKAYNERVERAMKTGYLEALLELNGHELEVHMYDGEERVGVRVLLGVKLYGVGERDIIHMGYRSDVFLP